MKLQLHLKSTVPEHAYRFRILGNNGEIVAQGEGYQRFGAAVRTLRRIFAATPELMVQLHEIEVKHKSEPRKWRKHRK